MTPPLLPENSVEPAPVVAGNSGRRELDRSLVHGIAWTGAVKWLVQLTSWLGTFFVAAMLTPEDYGVAGMALTYIAFVQLINEFGLSAAVVQRRDLSEHQIARLGGLSILMGCGFALLSLALAAPVALYFKTSDVRAVVMVLSITFVTSGLQVLPRSLLTRELRFRRLAFIEGAEALVAMVTTVILAWLGFRYWSLVVGGVAGRLVSTVLALVSRGHRVAWPNDFASIAPLVTFGSHILIGGMAWYVFRNADQVFVGRRLGLAALGAYEMALTFASIPVDRVVGVLTRATPAIFASVQHDVASLRRYFVTITEGISLIGFPAAVGLALVADGVIDMIGHDKWAPAIWPLRVLALAAVLRTLTPLMNQVLIATGQSGRSMRATIATAVALPPLFFIATYWGITAVAAVWLVGFPIVGGVFFLYHCLHTCELSLASYLRAIRPAAVCTLLMALAVMAVALALPESWPSAVRLGARCGVGATAYGLAMFALHRTRLRELMGQLRALRR